MCRPLGSGWPWLGAAWMAPRPIMVALVEAAAVVGEDGLVMLLLVLVVLVVLAAEVIGVSSPGSCDSRSDADNVSGSDVDVDGLE